MAHRIDPLPYPVDALEPVIGARTLEIHYWKHHRGYLDRLNRAIEGTSHDRMELEDLIRTAEGDLFDLAAQVWNHTFYWKSMRPGGGGKPDGMLRDLLDHAFGSIEHFRDDFADAANGEFGSGWAWLVQDRYGRLKIRKTSDAENPLQDGYRPLLTIDVWEHAYYLDHQNERHRYVQGFIDRLIDWDFVAANLLSPSEEPSRERAVLL